MNGLSKYLGQPHRENCDCSVCWSKRETAVIQSHWELCTQCRPGHASMVDGRLRVVSASYCEKHKPGSRPPKWWHVVYNSGKITPYVPLVTLEPFPDDLFD